MSDRGARVGPCCEPDRRAPFRAGSSATNSGWTERERVLLAIAESAVDALRLADVYLDGFVWLTEPEASELEGIQAASENAQRMLDECRGAIYG